MQTILDVTGSGDFILKNIGDQMISQEIMQCMIFKVQYFMSRLADHVLRGDAVQLPETVLVGTGMSLVFEICD